MRFFEFSILTFIFFGVWTLFGQILEGPVVGKSSKIFENPGFSDLLVSRFGS